LSVNAVALLVQRAKVTQGAAIRPQLVFPILSYRSIKLDILCCMLLGAACSLYNQPRVQWSLVWLAYHSLFTVLIVSLRELGYFFLALWKASGIITISVRLERVSVHACTIIVDGIANTVGRQPVIEYRDDQRLQQRLHDRAIAEMQLQQLWLGHDLNCCHAQHETEHWFIYLPTIANQGSVLAQAPQRETYSSKRSMLSHQTLTVHLTTVYNHQH
jgi:hypothetical protein